MLRTPAATTNSPEITILRTVRETCGDCNSHVAESQLSLLGCGHSVCHNCINIRARAGLLLCDICVLRPKVEKNRYKCSEENCESMDIKQNLNICSTCTPSKTLEGFDQLFAAAICSTCAMRKHLKNSHEIIDFCAVYAKFQSFSMRKILEEKTDENLQICNVDFDNFEDLKNRERRLLEKCVENLENCECPTQQQNFFLKMEEFFESSRIARTRMHQVMSKANEKISQNIHKFWRENFQEGA
ncbi:unnamed protein product [Caenorhabditis angaria]|uniref:RING-type domain-containing protein n=1 Tax=Caenorhabditis angaria TaxID=860376 RepID=A0A9P1IGX8_9PELO|nr:unnamed protein product [Caenorhabditis angaria]